MYIDNFLLYSYVYIFVILFLPLHLYTIYIVQLNGKKNSPKLNSDVHSLMYIPNDNKVVVLFHMFPSLQPHHPEHAQSHIISENHIYNCSTSGLVCTFFSISSVFPVSADLSFGSHDICTS